MKKRYFTIAAFALMLLSEVVADTPTNYVATGVFYYWHHGQEEKTKARMIWSGPDPLDLFNSRLWCKRPHDFNWMIWNRFLRHKKRKRDLKPQFRDAVGTIEFGECEEDISRKCIRAISPDPIVAANVVNACMEALEELERQMLGEDKKRRQEKLAMEYYKCSRECERLEQRTVKAWLGRMTGDLNVNKKKMAECAKRIDELENWNVETNTWFKIMVRASVPTNVLDSAMKKQMARDRFWWDKSNRILGP